MKITIDFENGMQLTLKPENLQLAEMPGKVVITTRTDKAVIPLMFFNGSLATQEELVLRAAKAAQKSAADAPADVPTLAGNNA